MEHLPLYLPLEAKIVRLVHYKWMYPFERFLFHLKRKIGNKAHVEGSICEAYLMEEQNNFCKNYFGAEVDTKTLDQPRNCGVADTVNVDANLPSVFQKNGRYAPHNKIGKKDILATNDFNVAHRYVLQNCVMISPFER